MKQLKYFFTIFTAIVFMSILGCASTTKSEETEEEEEMDHSAITTKVKAAVLNEPTLKATEIKT